MTRCCAASDDRDRRLGSARRRHADAGDDDAAGGDRRRAAAACLQCDIVVVIVWSRMGTPLPADPVPQARRQHLRFGYRMGVSRRAGGRRALRAAADPRLSPHREMPARPRRRRFRRQAGPAPPRRGVLRHVPQPRRVDPPRGERVCRPRSLRPRPRPAPAITDRWIAAAATAAGSAQRRASPAGPAAAQLPLWTGSPFPGLRAFTPADAPIFFGRGRETDQLVRRLADGSRFIAVVGASGSGKSSLVAAGLMPRLADNAIEGSQGLAAAAGTAGRRGRPLAVVRAALHSLANSATTPSWHSPPGWRRCCRTRSHRASWRRSSPIDPASVAADATAILATQPDVGRDAGLHRPVRGTAHRRRRKPARALRRAARGGGRNAAVASAGDHARRLLSALAGLAAAARGAVRRAVAGRRSRPRRAVPDDHRAGGARRARTRRRPGGAHPRRDRQRCRRARAARLRAARAVRGEERSRPADACRLRRLRWCPRGDQPPRRKDLPGAAACRTGAAAAGFRRSGRGRRTRRRHPPAAAAFAPGVGQGRRTPARRIH
jgi:hypothetical protein